MKSWSKVGPSGKVESLICPNKMAEFYFKIHSRGSMLSFYKTQKFAVGVIDIFLHFMLTVNTLRG